MLAAVGVFVLYPLGRVVYLSLTDYDGITAPVFSGLDNYETLVQSDGFRRVMLNVGLLLLAMPLWVGIPFLIAVALFGQRGAGGVRSLLLIPGILPPVVAGSVLRIFLADDGPANASLDAVGAGGLSQSWLSADPLVLVTVAVVILWAVMGTGVMFYSAGLATMPYETVEAAVLDGARWRHLVWHIYRPALRPVTSFWILLLIVSTVTSFFPWVFSLTQGGPGYASTTIDFYVYQSGLVQGQLGVASAASVVGIVVIAVLLPLATLRRRRA